MTQNMELGKVDIVLGHADGCEEGVQLLGKLQVGMSGEGVRVEPSA